MAGLELKHHISPTACRQRLQPSRFRVVIIPFLVIVIAQLLLFGWCADDYVKLQVHYFYGKETGPFGKSKKYKVGLTPVRDESPRTQILSLPRPSDAGQSICLLYLTSDENWRCDESLLDPEREKKCGKGLWWNEKKTTWTMFNNLVRNKVKSQWKYVICEYKQLGSSGKKSVVSKQKKNGKYKYFFSEEGKSVINKVLVIQQIPNLGITGMEKVVAEHAAKILKQEANSSMELGDKLNVLEEHLETVLKKLEAIGINADLNDRTAYKMRMEYGEIAEKALEKAEKALSILQQNFESHES